MDKRRINPAYPTSYHTHRSSYCLDDERYARACAEGCYRELETELAHLERAISYQGQLGELAERLSLGLDNMDFTGRRDLFHLLVDEADYDDVDATIGNIISIEQLHPIPLSKRLLETNTSATPQASSIRCASASITHSASNESQAVQC